MMNAKVYVTPVVTDVLCGRGRAAFRHAGNQSLREKIAFNTERYMASESRFQKTVIIREVIMSVMREGGKFLQYDKSASKWFNGGLDATKNRVGSAFRDASVPGKVKCIKELRVSLKKSISFNSCPPPTTCTPSNKLFEEGESHGSPFIECTKPMPLRRQVASCPSSLLSLWASKLDFEPHPFESDSEDDVDCSSVPDLLEALSYNSDDDYYPTTIFVPK